MNRTKLNLNRCPFLSRALEYIRNHPGCCKQDVIYGVDYRKHIPNKTYANRNSYLNRLLSAGLVKDTNVGNKYSLVAV